MASANSSLYPSVAFDLLHIPGPAIPIVPVGLIAQRRTPRYRLYFPATKEDLRYLLVIVHLLLYIYNIGEILGKKEKEVGDNDTLPLLE